MGGGPILSNTLFFKKCPNNFLVSEKKYIKFFFSLGKGSKKKLGIFLRGGGVPSDFGSVSQLFLFVFKHGLNQGSYRDKESTADAILCKIE